jgi:peroxiredoxin
MSALHGLQARLDDFDAAEARIVAISPDSVDENLKVVRQHELSFPVLSDLNLAVTRALDLVHEKGGMPPEQADVPRPAVFIVVDGVIRWRSLTNNWRVRVRPDALLEALAEI